MTKTRANIGAAVLISAMVLAPGLFPGIASWFVVVICMTAFLLILGALISKRPLGVLVNQQNLMSLSRFQMVMWTLIILSAYFVIARARISAGTPDALAVKIDWQLWALMGISATSLVGSPLINSTKKQRPAADSETEKTANALVEAKNTPDSIPPADKTDPVKMKSTIKDTSQGILYANPTIADASFADLFEGDEVGNTAYVDLAKVQMFYFTVILGAAYVATLLPLFAKLRTDPSSVNELPALSEGMVALLGISHAGFLASKGVDHTK